MSVVLDEKGAQILPPVNDQWATVSAWAAMQCASADHRANHPVYAELASMLVVMAA